MEFEWSNYPRNKSEASKLKVSQTPFIVEMQLLCESNTPFGIPVDPEVYMIIATSLLFG